MKGKIKYYQPNERKWKFWNVGEGDKEDLERLFKNQDSVRRGIIKKWKFVKNTLNEKEKGQ